MIARTLSAALFASCLAMPCLAQDAPQDKPAENPTQRAIRNAPSPRALELSAYIFSAANVCGYRIGTDAFKELLAKLNTTPEDVSPRGPFAQRLTTMFSLMSNDMAKHREQSCIAVAGEYGPEGNIAKHVLLPAEPGQQPPAVEPAPAKPAQ